MERQNDRSQWLAGRRADLIACAVLSLFCVITSAIIGIHGEFPLNDDWAYAQTTRHLLETGSLERSSWTWVPMITNSVIGSAFSWVFGFSCETLRLSGVFMGWWGVLGTYVLCRQVGAPILAALLGAAVIALNPLHVNLSHTFMTDVPFAAMMTWSLAFLCRGLAKRSWVWIALGTVSAEGAVLSRQPGLAIPIAMVIVLVVIRPRSGRHLLAGAAITVVTAVTYFVLPQLILGPQDSGTMFGFSSLQSMVQNPSLTWHLGVNGLAQLSYLGAFLAPATLGLVALSRRASGRLVGVSLVLTGLSVVAIRTYAERLHMPLGLNVIYDFGLGPATLHGLEWLPQAGAGTWMILTTLGLGAGFFAFGTLLSAAWKRRHRIRHRADCLLLALVPVIYLPPLLVRSPCFDRYLLPLLPPLVALLLVLPRPSQRSVLTGRVLGIAVLVVMGVFAVAGTRDYLEHHRCRWTLLEELIGKGINTADINGGFEFNSWYHFADHEDKADWKQTTGKRFVVSLVGHHEGYRAISTLSYRRLLPPGTQTITVLEADR